MFAALGSAGVLDFDSQGLHGPAAFPGNGERLDTAITGGVEVILTGGVILTKTNLLPADQTSVYGTVADSHLSNPITVSFETTGGRPTRISNFFVDIFNGQNFTVNYQLQDNAGHVATFRLAPNTTGGATTVGFPATGTQVTITAAPVTLPHGTPVTPAWDYFIDNIHFDELLPMNLPPSLESRHEFELELEREPEGEAVPEPATLVLFGGIISGSLMAVSRRLRV